MDATDTAKLLSLASGIDNRTFTPETAMLWAETLDRHITLDQASRAVIEHFGNSSEYLMPAHVNMIVRTEARREAPDLTSIVPPRELADTPPREIAWKRAYADALHDGDHDTARKVANLAFGITEEEPLAIGDTADLIDQVRGAVEKLAESQSLKESERREQVVAFHEAKMRRRSEMRAMLDAEGVPE